MYMHFVKHIHTLGLQSNIDRPNTSSSRRMGWDSGEPIYIQCVDENGEQYQNLIIQPNKSIKDPNIATLAKQDPHQQLATVKGADNYLPTEKFVNMAQGVFRLDSNVYFKDKFG